MKASELRIGNYVLDERCVADAIRGILPDELHLGNSNSVNIIPLSEVKPIPLTEEWLLKFGFEKGTDFFLGEYRKGYYTHGNLEVNLDDQFSPTIVDPEYNVHDIGNRCEYVHQLQNLYFALTGEELTPKLESSPANNKGNY